MSQIPCHGLPQTCLQIGLRLPTQFVLDAVGIECIRAVVACTVGDVLDEVAVVADALRFVGGAFFEDLAQSVDEVDVAANVAAGDVVRLTDSAVLQDEPQGADVVFNVEPVAALAAIAVNRQALAVAGALDDAWNEFFRVLARAIVVAAMADEGGQTVGALPCLDKVVGGGFAGGIGRAGGIRVVFAAGGLLMAVAINFIGGDVQKAKTIFLLLIK